MDDTKIISLFFERSEKAIEALREKYGRLLLHICNNVLNDFRDAEECVNETYENVWNRIPPERPDSLKAFVCRIAKNVSINRYHYNHMKKRDSCFDVCLEEVENSLFCSSGLAGEVQETELTELINSFVAKLGKTDRIIIVCRYWNMEDYDTIARKTGLSKSAVYTRMSRIMANLKKHLIKEGAII